MVEQDLIRLYLTEDLLKNKYKGRHPLSGHCYVASEAYYHLNGGKESGLKPHSLRIDENMVHWFLKDRFNRIIDLTAEQFDYQVPYETGRARGFLTKGPSKRAMILINKVNGHRLRF